MQIRYKLSSDHNRLLARIITSNQGDNGDNVFPESNRTRQTGH